ncbi:uncharacterized protein LOC122051140 isoform X2 [Zingiber officinale]|uniref:uncharacterized protein LOC122051140 isoform X2 n=1 Tax=Zingiber officinale TaxID=94328 RepID=UPI001C4D50F8|nr:uncharacterized protein LOC122051140 isoform X2 [Zingiber officinale]
MAAGVHSDFILRVNYTPSREHAFAYSGTLVLFIPFCREHAFADGCNLEHCVKYLNQTLVIFGFSTSLDLFATDPVSIARTCNCIHSLLQQKLRDIEFREGSNDHKQRRD